VLALVDKMSVAIYKPIWWQGYDMLDGSLMTQYPSQTRDFYSLQNFET